jgi:hypothetical protein
MVQFRRSCFIGLAKRYDVRRQGTNNLALNTRGPACLKLPKLGSDVLTTNNQLSTFLSTKPLELSLPRP